MGHVVKELPWCVIDIDTTEGRVFLQERWKYTWMVRPPLRDWTLEEKRAFHNRADRSIWAAWSNRARLNATGTSDFARRFNTRGVPINLDIRWVTSNEHWNVTVWKIPENELRISNVNWNTRAIELDTNDFNTRVFNHSTGTTTRQVPVAHEFGHAVGNTAVLNRGDEYKNTSPHANDHGSILHSGNQLRDRHFTTIIEELNRMIPNTTFSVRSL